MYGIQATAEVDIGSSLHVPEVCIAIIHVTMESFVLIIRHVILYGQNMRTWEHDHHVTNTITSILPSNTIAQIACLLLGPNASLKVCLSFVTAKKIVFSTWWTTVLCKWFVHNGPHVCDHLIVCNHRRYNLPMTGMTWQQYLEQGSRSCQYFKPRSHTYFGSPQPWPIVIKK